MRRRFLLQATGIALSAAVGSRWALAQTSKRVPRVAYVWIFNAGPSRPFEKEFVRRMAELGWVEGKTVSLEFRNADGDPQKLASIVRELVDSKVDLIVGSCTPEAKAAQKATSTIPIVVAATGDAVKSGLAASFARPGGNVTGVSGMWLEHSKKRVEIFKEAIPSVTRAAVVWNPERPDNKPEVDAMVSAANSLGMQLDSWQVRTAAELKDVLDINSTTRPQALFNAGDNLIGSSYPQLLAYVNRHRIPTMFEDSNWVLEGGLMSYGPNIAQMHGWAAEYVDKILRGANPAEMPIRQPERFELFVNLKTASALGITIPKAIRDRADQVV